MKSDKSSNQREQSPSYLKAIMLEQALIHHYNDIKNLSTYRPYRIVVENEEVEKSQVILAAQEMVDSIQKMVEEVSDMLVKELPAVVDGVNSEVGANEGQQFNDTVSQSLTALQASLTEAKNGLQGALNSITGQGASFDAGMEAPAEMPGGDMAGQGRPGPMQLEGLPRNSSTHAAGVVIGDRPLAQLVPLYRDPRSDMPATQFNMKWVEPAGLVKFDFLGLKTLTTLAITVKLLAQRDVHVALEKIPLDDKKTYEMMGRGETIGVFQVESAGMRKALAEMRADRLEDIIALVALYRPGPMANIPTYCARKHGEEEPDYIHPLIEPILKETFGVII